MHWINKTSYSRGDDAEARKDKNASVWELKAGDLTITLHRLHGYDETAWFLTCHELRIRDKELANKHAKVAGREALVYVRSRTKALAAQARLTTKATWEDSDT